MKYDIEITIVKYATGDDAGDYEKVIDWKTIATFCGNEYSKCLKAFERIQKAFKIGLFMQDKEWSIGKKDGTGVFEGLESDADRKAVYGSAVSRQ